MNLTIGANTLQRITGNNMSGFKALASPAYEDLKLKSEYMISDGFLKDSHNQEMFSLIDSMMAIRDKISESVKQINSNNPKEELKQGINGFSRIKKYLEKNPGLNFSKFAGFTCADNDYSIARSKIYNKSREIFKLYNR